MRLWLAAVVAACTGSHARTFTTKTSEAGVSIALYNGPTSYGVVDDRRWVVVTGTELELDHIDPGATLASLVIEPLAADRAPIKIAQCTRARLSEPPPVAAADKDIPFAPPDRNAWVLSRKIAVHFVSAADRFDAIVRCTVDGAVGRHLVRILYVSTTLTFRALHEFTVTAPDRATLTSRFAIETPAWHDRADVALFDGSPGSEQLPHEVARGAVTLDGSTAVFATPAREVAARLRRVFDGAVATPNLPGTDAAWYGESVKTVTVWLELPGLHLANGVVRVHVELPGEAVRDVIARQLDPKSRADANDLVPPRRLASLRLALWDDESLTGTRQRYQLSGLGGDSSDRQLAERVLQSVANTGETPREVWIEEHVRPARRRKIDHAWPSPPSSRDDLVRSQVTVKPRAIERVGYTLEYEF